jgi:PAS domain S-box-containing protein
MLLLGAMVANGVWWMEWNARTLDGTLADGVWFNYAFSFTALALGLGSLSWSVERWNEPRYDRVAAASLRMLPLALVVASALAMAFAGHMEPIVRQVALIGGVGVTVLAAGSQLLTLRERDALVAAELGRAAAERALRLSQARLHDVVQASSDAIFTVRVEADGFRYEEMNPAALAAVGLNRAQVVGHTPAEIFPPETAAAFEGNYRRCTLAGSPVVYDEQVVAAGGSTWFSTALVPLRDDEGRVTSLTGIARNVTAERQLVEAMRLMNVDLERRVAERTAELEVSNRELEAFAYSVSHDLRAPLRAIDGFSQILEEEGVGSRDPKARGYLEKIRHQARRMGELIDDLLTLSRVTRAPLRRETFDLSSLVDDVIADLRAREPERGVTFSVAPGARVSADRNLVRVALENLLANAWKFTRNNPRASIAFEVTSENGERRFAVRDDGAGFDPAYTDKLFVAFQRLHRTDEFEGTGIGLATVQRIVARHGGRIWGEGHVGKGATFWFTLPD